MNLSEITIRVSDSLADAYRAASEDDRRKINLLLGLRLSEALQSQTSLADLVTRIADRARERGLTDEILKSLLAGDS